MFSSVFRTDDGIFTPQTQSSKEGPISKSRYNIAIALKFIQNIFSRNFGLSLGSYLSEWFLVNISRDISLPSIFDYKNYANKQMAKNILWKQRTIHCDSWMLSIVTNINHFTVPILPHIHAAATNFLIVCDTMKKLSGYLIQIWFRVESVICHIIRGKCKIFSHLKTTTTTKIMAMMKICTLWSTMMSRRKMKEKTHKWQRQRQS